MQGNSVDPGRERGADPAALPPPAPEAQAFVAPLLAQIRQAIASAGGGIPFAEYMEMALYAPGLGYYSAGLRKFGAGGDFVTAPELSPLFGRCLARQCHQILAALDSGQILEAGAGSGRMAAELLAELERLHTLPERYLILEVSAHLRQVQAETLGRRVPHLLPRVQWLDRLPPAGFRGVVLANEVLDAMPVHRVGLGARSREDLEWYVGDEDGRFAWRAGPVSAPPVTAAIARIREDAGPALGPGYVTEVGLAASAWVRSLGTMLAGGALLVIDYGFPRREFYHPQRSGGTLMCHYRHRAHDDPLILTGLQDITAHVDFTSLAEAAAESGLRVAGYTSQADFLLALDLLAMLESARRDAGEAGRLDLANQVKRLTLPSEMGEVFKVLALTRGIDRPLAGFSGRDRRAGL